jgi:hypothetical protein
MGRSKGYLHSTLLTCQQIHCGTRVFIDARLNQKKNVVSLVPVDRALQHIPFRGASSLRATGAFGNVAEGLLQIQIVNSSTCCCAALTSDAYNR